MTDCFGNRRRRDRWKEEIVYGSKPVTLGTKRFAGNTPTKRPNKCRKVTHQKLFHLIFLMSDFGGPVVSALDCQL